MKALALLVELTGQLLAGAQELLRVRPRFLELFLQLDDARVQPSNFDLHRTDLTALSSNILSRLLELLLKLAVAHAQLAGLGLHRADLAGVRFRRLLHLGAPFGLDRGAQRGLFDFSLLTCFFALASRSLL